MTSSPSFCKLSNGAWGVRIHGPHSASVGAEVTVTKRDGSSKTVRLGARELLSGGTSYYAIAREASREHQGRPTVGFKERAVTVTEPGVYETPEGVVYVVRPNRQKSRMYAKKLVEINAQRATEAGERVKIEFEYESGAIYRLTPEMKMPLERAKALTIRYGRCIAAQSVERGIGPVCIKSFAVAA
jgi:hypothetical protein